MGDMTMATNLKRLRIAKDMSQAALAKASGVSQQLISQIERGVNSTTKELPDLARALGATIQDIDESFAPELTGIRAVRVPVLSMISAGVLMRDDVADEALGMINVADLPPGDWIALKVVGSSMDRISPPDSTILIDRRDRRLVPNGLYVIADEDGNATYKRYRPNPPRFEPVSTDKDLEAIFPQNDPVIIGRVRRSILDT